MAVAVATKRWTLEELHSLPDDGNKYELVRGDLFVTPPPSHAHELISARLAELLVPYVSRHGLGYVFHPRAVFRFGGSEVEPDLMVVPPAVAEAKNWNDSPTPILMIEIVSPSTRRRDYESKRALYSDSGIPEYWIVDPDTRSVRVVRPAAPDLLADRSIRWSPSGASEPLDISLDGIF